jgi:hypothetical protein
VQPVQLSLIPEQVPAPSAVLVGQLPAGVLAAAVALLADLIAKAAQAAAVPAGREAAGDE